MAQAPCPGSGEGANRCMFWILIFLLSTYSVSIWQFTYAHTHTRRIPFANTATRIILPFIPNKMWKNSFSPTKLYIHLIQILIVNSITLKLCSCHISLTLFFFSFIRLQHTYTLFTLEFTVVYLVYKILFFSCISDICTTKFNSILVLLLFSFHQTDKKNSHCNL